MKLFKTLVITSVILPLILCCCFTKKKPEVIIKTKYGNIVIELYNETPKHRDNFIKLINDSFYCDLLFHRVIKEFVIQGGDPDSKNAKPGLLLGEGDLKYTVPSEFNPTLIHKRGALAAARESDNVNPLKESSAVQFYIVHGKKQSSDELDKIEERKNKEIFTKKYKEILIEDSLNQMPDSVKKHKAEKFQKDHTFKYTKKQREIYMNLGGTPRLDMNYTVFGEVKEGMEVVDKIANLQTDKNDRPIDDIRFTIIMKN